MWDFAREALTRVTFDPVVDRAPVWLPDGRRMVFSSQVGGTVRGPTGTGAGTLFWRAADGTGAAERLGQEDRSLRLMLPSSVSPDGTRVVTTTLSDAGAVDVMMLTLPDRRMQPLIQTPFVERNGEISPDGRWLAYESNASGRFQIYVRPFPNANDGQWQVSNDGGTQPLWARSGEELFYVAPDRTLSSVPVKRGTTWREERRGPSSRGRYSWARKPPRGCTTCRRTANGSSMIKDTAADQTDVPGSIVVVQNWYEELKRLVPTR